MAIGGFFVSIYDVFCWQDGISLMTDVDLDGPWNRHSQVPVHRWLQHQESEEDAQRVMAMGNIVVPVQARKAISNLSEMLKQV